MNLIFRMNFSNLKTFQHSGRLPNNLTAPRGWEIAAAHIPQLRISREILKKESANLEITGDIPQGFRDAMKEILVQRFNKFMSPILNGNGKDLPGDAISHIDDFF